MRYIQKTKFHHFKSTESKHVLTKRIIVEIAVISSHNVSCGLKVEFILQGNHTTQQIRNKSSTLCYTTNLLLYYIFQLECKKDLRSTFKQYEEIYLFVLLAHRNKGNLKFFNKIDKNNQQTVTYI